MVQSKKFNDMSKANGTNKYNNQQSNMSFQRGGNRNDGRAPNGNSPSFRTDSAISANRGQGERVLQKWVPDAPEEVDNFLESSHNSSEGGWDQFAENERRFGLKTDYDENIYTTTIDKSHPLYRQRLAEADRKAKEIERSATTNSHVAEERIADNLKLGSNSNDEEAKYSSVARNDFPPLGSSNNSNKYTPPARRPPTGQPTVSGAPVDPAIISSQLARPDKLAADKTKPAAKVSKPEATAPVAAPATPAAPVAPAAKLPTETKPATKATPEVKAVPSKTIAANASTSATRTGSPSVQPDGARNATATVERDVTNAFKKFAGEQRRNFEQARHTKAKNDKEVKLNDLKKFADTFKLHTPVPTDLIGIIAKDPTKQKEIQEKAKRNAEEAKSNSAESVKPVPSQPDTRSTSRPTAANAGSSPAGMPSRQNPGRGNGAPHQGQYSSNSYRGDRSAQGQPMPQQGHATGNLASRLRNGAQQKHGQPLNPIPQPQFVPTGPSMGTDPNASRRSSGVNSAQGARLNPNSNEFRPNAFAPSFTPTGLPSATSSPLSNGNTVVEHQPRTDRSLLKRKPVPKSERPDIKGKFNILENVKTIKPAAGQTWDKKFGGLRPPYNTPPVWKQPTSEEDPKAPILKTYVTLFEETPFPAQQPMSPINPTHAMHQGPPHQHQLPVHLQQTISHMPRQSPRQPPTHPHHGHGPNPSFNGADDHHRMMPSLSTQSQQTYASPRLQNVPMGAPFPSPMGQPAQMFNGQQMMYPPQMARQFSQGQQFMPQGAHMAGPGMMMPGPANGFMGPQGMAPGPQMMFPPGQQGHFIPPGGGPPGMPMNGFPSPGRGAPMMISQGSQQGHAGQPIYGMSPSQQFGQMAPMYAGQQPGQMPIRGYGGQQQFGTSPQQMHQYGGQHRNHQNGNYNNKQNFQHNGPHANNTSPNNQVPNGPQARPSETVDEAK